MLARYGPFSRSCGTLLDQNLLGTELQAQKAIADAKVRSDFLHQGIGPLKTWVECLDNSDGRRRQRSGKPLWCTPYLRAARSPAARTSLIAPLGYNARGAWAEPFQPVALGVPPQLQRVHCVVYMAVYTLKDGR
jgi:hypothetical protein